MKETINEEWRGADGGRFGDTLRAARSVTHSQKGVRGKDTDLI